MYLLKFYKQTVALDALALLQHQLPWPMPALTCEILFRHAQLERLMGRSF